MATIKTRIGPADHGRPMSLDEFREADEEPGYRYELSKGVVDVVEVPNDPHRQIVWNLEKTFVRYDLTHPGVILCGGGGGEFQLALEDMASQRHPDAGVVLRGTPPDARGRRQPSLVVEVVSSGSEHRDYEEKRQDYQTFGSREYWIVDPALQQVTVLVRHDSPAGPSWRERIFRGEEPILSEVLPGLAGTVAELWIDADLDTNGAG
jgi:Uma2 family endonuclease